MQDDETHGRGPDRPERNRRFETPVVHEVRPQPRDPSTQSGAPRDLTRVCHGDGGDLPRDPPVNRG
jgi:hypothetical protein